MIFTQNYAMIKSTNPSNNHFSFHFDAFIGSKVKKSGVLTRIFEWFRKFTVDGLVATKRSNWGLRAEGAGF